MIDKKALGLTLGILCGLSVLLMTAWVMVVGGGDHLKLLGRFYIGYTVGPLGLALGTIYGFIDGFIGGWLFGWLYNRLAAPSTA